MPDISMCDNKECADKHTCARYMAVPHEYRQAYFLWEMFKPKDKLECEHYFNVEDGVPFELREKPCAE